MPTSQNVHRLHRARLFCVGGWRISGTQIVLLPAGLQTGNPGWQAASLDGDTRWWLRRNRILGQAVTTRHELLRSVAALSVVDPPPTGQEARPLRRTAHGWITADGHWTVTQDPDGALIADAASAVMRRLPASSPPFASRMRLRAPTLRHAAYTLGEATRRLADQTRHT